MLVAAILFTLGAPNLYESLYQSGYHSDLRLSHAQDVLKRVSNASSVLDLGCSHGFAVSKLWKKKIQANGIDIAPTAIALATKSRGRGLCGNDPCFQTGNATFIPFPDKHFETIISTDVLEHIAPTDVDAAIRETLRVTRRDMWLKIATRKEVNRQPLRILHRKNAHMRVTHLHTTIMDLDAWSARFKRLGANGATVVDGLLHVDV